MTAQTVRDFAVRFNCVAEIERAITFDARLYTIWTVPVTYNFNLRNSAGQANKFGIELHPGLLKASPAEFRATFLHELAHVCEGTLYGRYGHSQHWWEAMIRLGERPWENRRHSIAACQSRDSLRTVSLDALFPQQEYK